MAYQYIAESYMCRTDKATKLYKHPSDIKPSISAILQPGTLFVSERSVVSGKTILRQITYSPKNESIPFQWWCSDSALDIYPIETEGKSTYSDDTIEIHEQLLVNDVNVAIYGSKDSITPKTHTLKAGDLITADREYRFKTDTSYQTRYHIADVSSNDVSIVGSWITLNNSVKVLTEPEEVSSTDRKYKPENPKPVNVESLRNFTAIPKMKLTDEMILNVNKPIVLDDETITAPEDTEDSAIYDSWEDYVAHYSTPDTSLGNVPIGRMTFVHGMPFQYTYITDRRYGATGRFGYDGASVSPKKNADVDMYGRTFAKEIAANMPVIVVIPGEPEYLTKASGVFGFRSNANSLKENFSPFWGNLSQSEWDSAMENLLGDTADGVYDYFSFKVNMTEYYKYANSPCRTAASLMGIGKRTIMGKPCGSFDWADYNRDASQDYNIFSEIVGYGDGISFAYDPLSSVSDTIQNSTTESQFAGMLQQLTGQVRELAFMTGQVGGATSGLSDYFNDSDYEGVVGDSGLIGRAKSLLQNVTKGFNIRFPEIWSDSNHTQSYDINMHFITPYNTNYCKWRYVLCPFFLWFSLTAPQAPLSMSVYGRPFLIRAFSLGYFNVENGIIESLQWKRFGDEGDMISQNGIPTQIDVSVSFKNLYHTLTQGKTNSPTYMSAFFTNIGLMDMIGSLSGVNVNYLTLSERVGLYFTTAVNMVGDIPTNFMSNIQDRMHRVFDRFIYGQ